MESSSIDLEKLKKASEIFIKVEKSLGELIKPDLKILDIAENIEKRIIEMGGTWAFPTNISIGNIAAHYTPNSNEETLFPKDKIIKIDFGVSVNGYIVDGARSFYFGDNDEQKALIQVANDALDLAIKSIKPGLSISEITYKVHDYIKEHGFKPISNLHGHQIERWKLHGEKDLPFDPTIDVRGTFEPNEIYAVEIFVTTGSGYAETLDDTRIYSLPSIFAGITKRVKLPIHIRAARDLFYWIFKTRKTLPFSIRHLQKKFDIQTIKIGIAILEQGGLLIKHPVLAEKDAPVAQAEDTILIKKDGVDILTRSKGNN